MAEKAPWETEEEIAPWETPAPQEERMVPSISLEGLGRGALEALPIAGGIAGGIIGAGGGPLGMIGGSSLGAVAGKSLEQAGKEFFFDEGPKTREEQFKQLGQEAIYGGLGEVGGQAIGKGISAIASKAAPTAEWIAKKTGKVFANIPEEYTAKYIEARGKIEAPERVQILDELNELYNKSQSAVEQAATKQTLAKDELSQLKTSIQNEFRDKKFTVKSQLDEVGSKLKDKTQAIKETLSKDVVTPLKDSVIDSMESLKSDLSKLSGESYKILENDPNAYSVRKAGQVLRQMASDLNIQPFETKALGAPGAIGQPITAETKALQNKIIELAERFEATPERLPAKELKKIIQQLDQSAQANYNSLEFDTRVSQAYKLARSVIDNAIKTNNPLYAEKMAELAPKTALYEQVLEKFGKPEKIISKLQNIGSKTGQMIDLNVLDELGQATKKDFRTPLQEYIQNQTLLKTPSSFNQMVQQLPEAKQYSQLEQAYNILQNPETERSLWQSPQFMAAQERAGVSLKELEKAQQDAALFRGFSPMQVEGKVKSLTGARQYGPTGLFEQVKEATGVDYAQQIRNREILDQFLKADTQGSRKALTGSVVGSAIGSTVAGTPGAMAGGALGSMTGMALDRYGGQVFKKGLDVWIKGAEMTAPFLESLGPQQKQLYKGLIQKYFEAPSGQIKEEPAKQRPDQSSILQKLQGTPYQQVLQRALEQGGEQSFSAANYVLMNRDQKYRELINQEA